MSPALAAQPRALQRECLLAGGDDYELLFTAAADAREQVLAAAAQGGVAVTRIGRIERSSGLRLVDAQGAAVKTSFAAFDHFRSAS